MEQINTTAGEDLPVEPEVEAWDLEDEEVLDSEPNGTEEMGELPVEDWDYQRPKRGQVRSGVILAIEDQEIIVDVGVKRDGIVPFADMQRMGPDALAELSVGDEVPVFILRPEDRDGNLLVSLYLARQEEAWQRAQELADSGQVWEGEVIGYNKGGVVVPVGEIRGFVPASQVPGFPRGLNQEERLERLATLVGEKLMLKVIEINRRKRRLILSASAAQRQWRKQHRERLLDELREGEVRRGRVSSLCSFGAFVDLGGADGLIHLSELSWRRVRHPREAVRVGDEVEVYVLRLDPERKRIGLSLKRLQPEPWALVEDRYELGQLIEGVVTNVVDFGAFAEIEEGIEGLIHISELTDGSISHAREVVKRGDLLLLRIIRIDARRKRLGLSLKRVLESEWAEWAARLALEDRGEPGAQVDAPQPAEGQEMGEPAAPEPEEPEEAVDSELPVAEEAEDVGDGEAEPTEPEVVEEPEALVEPEEPAEAVDPEPPVAGEAEDAGDAEAETAEPEVVEEPEVLVEPEEAEEAVDSERPVVEEAEDAGDAEVEAAEPEVVEDSEALVEPEEPAEAVDPERPIAEEAEDVGDAEAETVELDVVEEPGELVTQEVDEGAPVVALVEELVEVAETDESGLTEIDGTGESMVSELGEMEGVGDSQSPESEGAEELVEMVLERSEEVHETPELQDTGVEEAETPEALEVDDPEMAAEEA